MGYTHYVRHSTPFEDAEWAAIVGAVAQMIQTAHREGIALSIDHGDNQISNHQMIAQAWLSDLNTGPVIMLNGVANEAHETFCLHKNGNRRDGFGFCKTARKPYDTVVVAILCWVETHYPGRLNASSDGYPGDWDLGLKLAASTFPNDSISLPKKVANPS